MPSETLLLVGREAPQAREVYRTHGDRLVERGVADAARVATYEQEPTRELRERFAALDADRVYAVPMHAGHSYDTTEELPAALSSVPGEVRYCEPPGHSAAVTDVVADRAAGRVAPGDDASLALVGLGSAATPHRQGATEYHAGRLRGRGDYGEVVSCYLMRNPAVECVRYNLSGARAVAVPLFLAPCPATERRIPAELDLDRGGLEYADPFGTHQRVTDAIHGEVEKRRALADGDAAAAAGVTAGGRPLAADGEG